jgi:hypothetical protein
LLVGVYFPALSSESRVGCWVQHSGSKHDQGTNKGFLVHVACCKAPCNLKQSTNIRQLRRGPPHKPLIPAGTSPAPSTPCFFFSAYGQPKVGVQDLMCSSSTFAKRRRACGCGKPRATAMCHVVMGVSHEKSQANKGVWVSDIRPSRITD